MFERFTERARQVVVLAQEEARMLQHHYIGTEHILLGLLREEEGLAARVLESLAVTLDGVRDQVMRIVGRGEEFTEGQIPFTPRAKKVLELALREALNLGHNYIGTEHILLGLTRENEGVAAQILLDLGANPDTIRNEMMRMLSGPGEREAARSMTPTTPRATSLPEFERPWFGELGVVLDELAAEIRRQHQRTPDPGDLLLVLAGAPDTLAGRALRELGADLQALPSVVERLRDQALAEDQLAQQLNQLTEAQHQAVETLTRLRAQERELRKQAEARTAIGPEVLHTLRSQLGIIGPADNPPQP